jgi:hypothetical protein
MRSEPSALHPELSSGAPAHRQPLPLKTSQVYIFANTLRLSGTSFSSSVSIVFVTECQPEVPVCLRTIDSAMVLPQSSHKRQLLAIAASACAESGLLAYAAGQFVVAMLLGAISSATLSWVSISSKLDDPRLARDVAVRTVLGLALVLVTATTVLPNLRRLHFFHDGAGSSRTPTSTSVDQRTGKSGQPRSEVSGPLATNSGDAYSGIVLWSKKQRLTKLIAPPPMSWDQTLLRNQRSVPLIIPFDGVYWFFREPDIQPPAKSRQAEGSPEMFDIHSTDWRPLSMEAHQNLGTLIGLNCCGRIQVAVRNADRYPTSISLEVILVDTTAAGRPSQSLGRIDIVSNRRWGPDPSPRPTTETLNFPIPSNSVIHRFDEVTVLFRLDGFRAQAAAKIGIDHFTLIPRGL